MVGLGLRGDVLLFWSGFGSGLPGRRDAFGPGLVLGPVGFTLPHSGEIQVAVLIPEAEHAVEAVLEDDPVLGLAKCLARRVAMGEQVVRADDLAVREREDPLDDVPQLSGVPRPVVLRERADGLPAELDLAAAHLLGVSGKNRRQHSVRPAGHREHLQS